MKYILENISPGGAGRNRVLNKKDFLKISINLPPLQEQRKITDFLSSLDGLIESKQNYLYQTEQWKRGLMQQLFV
jgi:type I restriction enzyme, S subunit